MMTISGLLSEFSLPEIFQFLEQGQKTGRLTLNSLSENGEEKPQSHHIWFRQGTIIAAANRLDSKGLLSLARQRGWITEQDASIIDESCLEGNCLGLFLKSCDILQAEQLKLLFYVQVMQQVCALFALPDAEFTFEDSVAVPLMEMTGLSSPSAEVTLAGLRALRDWNALAPKLPEPTSTLTRLVEEKPQLNLNQMEWQVWEFAGGGSSLQMIAQELETSLEKVQQVVFRLIVVNLVEELPMTMNTPTEKLEVQGDSPSSDKGNKGLSEEFLNSLMGFLEEKR